MNVDLNADVGEGAGTDAELMPWITSANVCCGFHAGDAETSAKTLELAKKHGVVCGAHPGFADRANFGRVEHPLDLHGSFELCNEQVSHLHAQSDFIGHPIRYVKPHGAIYHLAIRKAEVAMGLAWAMSMMENLSLVGLPNSQMELAAMENGIFFIPEGFADRRYLPDGTLVPRSEPNALLHDPKEVVEQVEWLVREKNVRTICVHGDTPGAVEFVRKVRESLLAKGHFIRAFAE